MAATRQDRGPAARWVAVASYPTRPFAQFIASALEGNGIEARVVGDDGGGMLPHVDTLTGGVHVEVREADAPAAQALLAHIRDIGPTDGLAEDPDGGVEPRRRIAGWRAALIVVVVTVLVLVVVTGLLVE